MSHQTSRIELIERDETMLAMNVSNSVHPLSW
jgi:hypothetical protein